MALYASVIAGVVHEIWTAPTSPAGLTPAECFPAGTGVGQAGSFVPCDATVQPGWTYDGKAFAAPPPPTLAQVQAAKVAELQSDCGGQIVGGYTSSALGAAHYYPSNATDQRNMLGSVTDSLIPGLPADWTTPFWCADGTGAWSFAAHTAAQIQQAGRDGKTAIAGAQTRLVGLIAQVEAATTTAAVAAISW